MKQAEENRQCFSIVWQMLNPTTPGGLTQLIVPTSDASAPWITIHDKETMEQHLLQHSREHFSQAYGTPFTQPPLTDLLNFDGVTPFGDTIFAGTPIPPDLDIAPATRLLLQHQRSLLPETENTDHPLDFDLLMQGFRKWPEKTTTSPSSHHLGIYKLLLKDQAPNNPPLDYIPRTHGINVMHYVYWLMKLAVRHTFPFKRWWTIWKYVPGKRSWEPQA